MSIATLETTLRSTRWHYSSSLYLLSWGVFDRATHEANLDMASDLGFNATRFNVWWHEIYPDEEAFRRGGNWEPLDAVIELAVARGLKVILTVSMRYTFANPLFFGDEDRVVDTDGKLDTCWDGTTRISYSSPKISHAIDFFRQFGERYRAQQNAGHILAISPLITRDAEIPYAHDVHEDMSPCFVAEYRHWLATRYTTETALAAAWGGMATRFSDIKPCWDFATLAGRDWYLFRDLKARQFVDSCCAVLETIPNVTTPYRVMLDYGNLGDPMAVKRGSISFEFHAKHPSIWGIKHNDAHPYDQRYTGSLLGSHAKRAGQVGFNEWFYHKDPKEYPNQQVVEDSVKEIAAHFHQGMNGVSYCGVMPINRADVEIIVRRLQELGEWTAPVLKRPDSGPTVEVPLSELLTFDGGWGIRERLFDRHIGTAAQLDIHIMRDLNGEPLPILQPKTVTL